MFNEQEVMNLIKSRKEGAYWDYKQKYHENKAKLLHDVLCLANNLENRIAYLIIGVNDNGDIVGIKPNDKIIKQADLIDLMRNREFSADYRPAVSINKLEIEGSILEVIQIEPNTNVPYYLTNDYQYEGFICKSNYIYTRTMDSNTPRNKSADRIQVEKLWKIHFGLIPNPMDRMKKFIENPKGWKDEGSDRPAYYSEAPEFTIEAKYEDSRNDWIEYYSVEQIHRKISSYMIYGKYHSTVLFDYQILMLNKAHLIVPVPVWGCINKNTDYSYKYYEKYSLRWKLMKYFIFHYSQHEQWAYQQFIKNIVVFENANEKDRFDCFCKMHEIEIETEINKSMLFDKVEYNYNKDKNERFVNQLKKARNTALTIKKRLEKWRNLNNQ